MLFRMNIVHMEVKLVKLRMKHLMVQSKQLQKT